MKAFLIAFLLAALSVTAQARPNSPKSGDSVSTGFVPVELGERILTYSNDRHYFTSDGRIVVCPSGMKVNDKYKCWDEKDPTESNKWVNLDELKIPGYERSGTSVVYAGMYAWRQLVVYYRKVSP